MSSPTTGKAMSSPRKSYGESARRQASSASPARRRQQPQGVSASLSPVRGRMSAPIANSKGMQGSPATRRHSNPVDEAAREALAMAAVAQAANASNKSPAEVAQLAKMQAQNLAKHQQQKVFVVTGSMRLLNPYPKE